MIPGVETGVAPTVMVVPATDTLAPQVNPLLPQVTGDGIAVCVSVKLKFWNVPSDRLALIR